MLRGLEKSLKIEVAVGGGGKEEFLQAEPPGFEVEKAEAFIGMRGRKRQRAKRGGRSLDGGGGGVGRGSGERAKVEDESEE